MSVSIITPAEHHRLTVLSAVKAELAVTSDADDMFLSALIQQVSEAIRAWCGRTFAQETVSETIYQNGTAGSLLLSRWPVASISSVTAAGNSVGPDGYDIDAASGLLHRITTSGFRSAWAPGRVVVTYVAGYTLPDSGDGPTLPADIERAAIVLVRNAYTARGRDPLRRSEDADGIAAVTYGLAASFPAEVEGLLQPYRQPNIG